MPRNTGRTPPPDPFLQRAMAKDGSGFFMPVQPSNEAVLSYLRLHCQEREQWDERAEVGVLRSPYEEQVTGYALPIAAGSWDTYDNPLKLVRKLVDVLWRQGRTDHALLRAADRSLLADMVGVYLRHEGWSPPKGHERQALAIGAGRPGYRFSDLTDRRESRSVLAVMGDSTRLKVTHFRDEGEKFRSAAYNPLALPNHRTTPILGDMPPLLLELAYGLIKHMRPPYANDPPKEPT